MTPLPSLTRRAALRRGSLLLGGALLAPSLWSRLGAQPAPAAPEFPSVETPGHPIRQMREGMSGAPLETIRLTDRHFVLAGHGGNIGVYLGDDGLLVIDSGSGLAPATDHTRDALRAISERSLRYVANTHWHFDHTDGNTHLHGLGATIVAHRRARARMAAPANIAFFNARFPAAPRTALPTLTFDQEFQIDLGGGEPALLSHVAPAHTDGDVIVHWPQANVIQTGDLFFSGGFPFIDGDSNGSLTGMIAAAERILALTDGSTRLIPGHGPVSGRAELLASRDLLRTVQERFAPFRAQGRTVDDVVAAQPLADLDARWGGGFFNAEAFTRFAYPLKS